MKDILIWKGFFRLYNRKVLLSVLNKEKCTLFSNCTGLSLVLVTSSAHALFKCFFFLILSVIKCTLYAEMYFILWYFYYHSSQRLRESATSDLRFATDFLVYPCNYLVIIIDMDFTMQLYAVHDKAAVVAMLYKVSHTLYVVVYLMKYL